MSSKILAALLAVFLVASFAQSQQIQFVGLTPQQKAILDTMTIVMLDDGSGGQRPTVRFTGVNVQVVNGLDATNGDPLNPTASSGPDVGTNGVGNLILGYNEQTSGLFVRTGSHNLIVGVDLDHDATFASILSGKENMSTARGSRSIVGGNGNLLDGQGFLVGNFNTINASGSVMSILGGLGNTVLRSGSTIVGGDSNTVSSGAQFAVVVGGEGNLANGPFTVVSGGENRTATGSHDWRAGSLLEDN